MDKIARTVLFMKFSLGMCPKMVSSVFKSTISPLFFIFRLKASALT